MNILVILVCGLFSTAESYGKSTAVLEIIIMLLVAFILGYLLRYFLSKDKIADLKDRCNTLEAQLDECRNDFKSTRNQTQPETTKPEKITTTKEPAHKDDLKKIEGIGPKIEKLLYAAGIYTYDDLAKTEVTVIQAILDKAGPNFRTHNPESWPYQAKLAAEGKWDELKKWQDEHQAGRF